MGKADTPAKRAYNDQYLKENMKQISLKLSKIYDEDIIQYLESKPNKNGFLKDIIRQHMESEKIKNA